MNTLTATSWLRWLETTIHPIPKRPVLVPYCPHTPVAPCVECEKRAGGGE